MNKNTQVVLFVLCVIGSITALKFAFSYEKEFPHPLLEEIKPIENTFIAFPDSISDKLTKEISLLIVLKDLSCPLCLNEAVDFIDFVTDNNNFEALVWYTHTDRKRVKNYYKALNRNIPYSFGTVPLKGENTLIEYNKIIFLSNKDFSIISSIPLLNQTTPKELKAMILKKITSLYDNNN